MNSLAFVLYSHSSLEWILESFVDRLNTHFPVDCNRYFFIDKDIKLDNFKNILYDNNKSYSERLFNNLNELEEEFVIIHHEDMIFYDDVDMTYFTYYLTLMQCNEDFSCMKLMRGGLSKSPPQKFANNVYYLQDDEIYRFAIQPSIWRRKDLIKILEFSKNMSIYDLENKLIEYMKNENIKILFCWDHEEDKKRGMYHWDNSKYPFVATALNKGNWNLSEYPIEIKNIKLEYGLK